MKSVSRPYLAKRTNGGKTRWYFRSVWWEGGKRRERFIALPDNPDSQEFDEAYWKARSGSHPKQQKPQTRTWRELVTAYRAGPRYRKLAPRTRDSYNATIEWILEANSEKSVTSLTRQKLRKLHIKYAGTPRKADMLVQIVSILTNYARKHLDWPIDNPAEGMELHGQQREYEPWPDWMVNKLPDAPEMVRSAGELILGTGQRPSAAIAMRRDQFRGEWMTVTDEKGDDSYDIFCPVPLRRYLATLPKRGAYVIAKNLTAPVRYDAVEKAFRAWRTDLGEKATPYSLHGLRKLAIVRLAEAGCTDAQIQAITNQSPQTVAKYRKRASRKKLSRQAAEQNNNGT